MGGLLHAGRKLDVEIYAPSQAPASRLAKLDLGKQHKLQKFPG